MKKFFVLGENCKTLLIGFESNYIL